MIRRTIRVGIRLGLFAGIAFAVFKIMQARRPSEPSIPPRAPWPPVPVPVPDVPPRQEARPVASATEPAPPPKPAGPTKRPSPPAPARKVKKAAKKATARAAASGWVEGQGQVCPLSHPIKAKLSSKIYHLPGMLNYTRTRPDRCYATEAAAKRDGFHAAKR